MNYPPPTLGGGTINLLNFKIMDKLKKIYEEWAKLNKELFQESEDYIKECLSTIDNSISLDECNVCVTYDGGSHPEYYANPYSHVERVYLKNGKIYVDTEDCYQYDIDNITASELFDIAESVGYIIENEYEIE